MVDQSYIIGHVPTDRVQRDWKLDIKTKEQYELAIASGIGWVIYPDLPFSWKTCTDILKEDKEKEDGGIS